MSETCNTPAWEVRPDDGAIVVAAADILLEDMDDAPLIRAAVMGGQGRTAAEVRSYGMAIVVPFGIGVVLLGLLWLFS